MKDFTGYKILIVDDSKINRMILSDIIDEAFTIVEAENGVEALNIIREQGNEISLMLLDLVMPEMDGLEVLAAMNRFNLINEIPVIMISAENSPSYVERAYELGVTDFINRPFNAFVVRKRIVNTIMLYSKQKNLVNLVSQQIYERQKNNDMMINILSHIVEFRNGESGLHILHVNTITGLVLRQLIKKTDKYKLTSKDIEIIVTASSLHDIGKISVPDEILNKPGRLTPQEFEIIKRHSDVGAKMLEAMSDYGDEPLITAARDICRYHHERYDGGGYPCGLKGDEIPISAQAVSIADVYDALVSERCYKKAIPHQKALEMICGGECGCFNPILLECLRDISNNLENEIKLNSLRRKTIDKLDKATTELLNENEISTVTDSSINYLEEARSRYEFFASMSQEIQYEYNIETDILTISEWYAEKLRIPSVIVEPLNNSKIIEIIGDEGTLKQFYDEMNRATFDNPKVEFTTHINVDGEMKIHRVLSLTKWSDDDNPKMLGVIGKLIDIEKEYQAMAEYKRQATQDGLTGLVNRSYSERLIKESLAKGDSHSYALVLLDLDDFKSANDIYGHLFGDKVLTVVANGLTSATRKGDVVARIGGDEFLIFVEYRNDEQIGNFAKRIHTAISSITVDDYTVKTSMGVAVTGKVGYDYKTLFNCADTALYYSKRTGKSILSFYNNKMKLNASEMTPIEN